MVNIAVMDNVINYLHIYYQEYKKHIISKQEYS